MKRIYLDNNAATKVDPHVLKTVTKHLEESLGNPSSTHFFGRRRLNELRNARETIADYLNVLPREIIFTSGGTEALNLAIKGAIRDFRAHVITSDIEHVSVYHSLKEMEKQGLEVSYLPAGLDGFVKPEQVQAALRPNTSLIVLSAANNETGVKIDLERMAQVALDAQIPFIVDGVALLGKEAITIHRGISAICFSGQKCHALKGVGVLFARNSLPLSPLFLGGDQEYGKRAGTENLPGIISMAEAIQILKEELPRFSENMKKLRDQLEHGLMQNLSGVSLNGAEPRLVNTSNLSFADVDGESLLIALDQEGIAASHGSACVSGALKPSRVLLNMGFSKERVNSSLRFSLSRFTTEKEVERAIEVIVRIVTHLRKIKLENK